MKRWIVLGLVALISLAWVQPLEAQVKFEKISLDAARRKATREQKYIFVDLYATWCVPCQMLDRKVFSKRSVGDFMNPRFVSLRFDIDREPGRTLARDYEVRSIPTMLIFDSRGNLLARTSGGRSASEFLEDMEQLLEAIAAREE